MAAECITDPNPHGLTFPYPLQGVTVRPTGQDCLSFVHQTYCPAVYWLYRNVQNDLTENMGRQCASWSDDLADQVRTVAQADLDEVEYIYDQGTGSEARRNGIVTPVTGAADKY